MSLQFIFGNSGSGKSHTLYQNIIEESQLHRAYSYLVIVPEQFTMQTQKDLVRMHPDGGILNIDVLSFGRLAHRIFEEVGTDRRSVLTETGKNLMLRRVAAMHADELSVLGGKMNRTGYVSEVKSVLSELMQYEVRVSDLEQLIEGMEQRPLLRTKLMDLRVLYEAFLEYQRERFMKPEERLDVLCQMAGRSKLLRSSVLAFDGFAGFTPAQLNVLEELLVLCPQIYVSVTIDARESFFGEIREHELFAPSRRLIRSVQEAAERAGHRRAQMQKTLERADAADGLSVDVNRADVSERLPDTGGEVSVSGGWPVAEEMFAEPIVLGKQALPRFRADGALFHLEQNLFRGQQKPFLEESGEISLHTASTPQQEVHFAARTICSLVRSGEYRYRDIAVITGKLSVYGNYIKKVFPMYDMPFFLDETRHILLNPCLEFVRGAIALAQQDYSCEAVFRFLRTGMAGFSGEETDRLENYVIAAGIRGRRLWEQEWSYLPPRFAPEELEQCNAARVRLMELTGAYALRMQQKNGTLRTYADALCDLLEACCVQMQLEWREQELLERGAREEASEYHQIYPILLELLDEMVDLLGEEQMNGQEFAQILDAGLSEARVGMIPPGIDQVQVGDIERSRLANVRVLFFLGLNDGWVPSRGDGGGIVSDMEREILRNGGMQLAPSARENSYIQRFYLYQNLTKPQDALYLSWCESSGDGAEMRPSYLAASIRKLFPKLEVHPEKDAGSTLDQVTSRENGMLYFLHGLQEIGTHPADSGWLELYRRYLKEEKYRGQVQTLVRAAFPGAVGAELTEETAQQLYGEEITASVTRLEQFASCAFAHFASYGLHLEKRQEHGVKAADLGTLFHRALELFSRQMHQEHLDFAECPLAEQQERMERCVELVCESYGGGILHGTAREEYTIRRLKRILRRTVWALHEQIRAGRFRPVGFEISFDDARELDAVRVRFGKNGTIRLQGRIDRIDTAGTEDAVYVRVIDYKSGMTQFDPVALYYGLQLQLVVYLNAALEMERRLHPEKEVVPAGIFYYRLQDPILDKEKTPQKAEEKLLKKLRPNGLINQDGPVLRLMDESIGSDSLVIPAGLKKDGTPKTSASLADKKQFAFLSRYVSELLGTMGARILEGCIEAKPFADRNGSACDYCIYSDVCGFDRKIPQRCETREPKLSAAQVWEALDETQGAVRSRETPDEIQGAVRPREVSDEL